MMRKLPNFSANLFETLMLFLLDVEDDPLWHQVRGWGKGARGGAGPTQEAARQSPEQSRVRRAPECGSRQWRPRRAG